MIAGVNNTNLDRGSRPADVQALTERLMAHRTLADARLVPVLSRLQLLLGQFILSRSGLTAAARERIMAALLLLYHGLDLHERIDGEGAPARMRRGQLAVLGGDYFSSLFYRLLAEAGRIDLIRQFAGAIADIQLAKTSLLFSARDPAYAEKQYLSDVMTVQGALLHVLRRAFAPDPRTEALVDAALRAGVYDGEIVRSARPERRFSRMLQGFREAMAKLQSVAEDLLGYEGWLQLAGAFSAVYTGAADGAPAVIEGS